MDIQQHNNMRVVFVGGKDVGCGCLDALLTLHFVEVVGVIINRQGDLAKDRWYRSVTEIALSHNIPILKPRSINQQEAIEFIQRLNPDLLTVVYYDQLLTKKVIDIPRMGCINVHMALAEEYRGCYPTTWALINDEGHSGVTVHYIDEDMDTGDIVAQTIVPIEDEDTGRTLYYKCTNAGIDLFKEAIELIALGKAQKQVQVTTPNTKVYHRQDFPCFDIKLKERNRELYNYVRALTFDPFPCPYFYIGDRKILLIEEDRLQSYGEERW